MASGLVPRQCGPHQTRIKAGIGLAQARQSRFQFDQSPNRRLFQQADGANHSQPATDRRRPPSAVVHQDGVGLDFVCEADGFQFACVHVQREIDRPGFLNGYSWRQ